jgi:hypothetical protein
VHALNHLLLCLASRVRGQWHRSLLAVLYITGRLLRSLRNRAAELRCDIQLRSGADCTVVRCICSRTLRYAPCLSSTCLERLAISASVCGWRLMLYVYQNTSLQLQLYLDHSPTQTRRFQAPKLTRCKPGSLAVPSNITTCTQCCLSKRGVVCEKLKAQQTQTWSILQCAISVDAIYVAFSAAASLL